MLAPSLEERVESGYQEDSERHGREHAPELGRAEVVAACRARARRDHHRESAEKRRKSRHEKRPKALARRRACGVSDRVALVLALVLRELDDQDRVLRSEAYEKDEAKLRVYRERIR